MTSKKWQKCSPNVGLEPTTVGLRVQRSTDWASRAWMIQHKSRISIIFICAFGLSYRVWSPEYNFTTSDTYNIWRTCYDRFLEFWDKWIRFLEFDSNYCWKALILSRESNSITHFWQVYINLYLFHQFYPRANIDVGDGCWRRNMLMTSLRCW